MREKRRRGFTLFEAVVSLAVLSMLVYICSTSLLKMAPKYALERAAWEVRSAMNAARYRALFEGETYRVRFTESAYETERYDESQKKWALAGRASLEKVRVQANNAPVFTPDGTVTGLATISISNAWGEYHLTLAITGRIKTTRIR
jgi:Tfp pilus assembly protein FimT